MVYQTPADERRNLLELVASVIADVFKNGFGSGEVVILLTLQPSTNLGQDILKRGVVAFAVRKSPVSHERIMFTESENHASIKVMIQAVNHALAIGENPVRSIRGLLFAPPDFSGLDSVEPQDSHQGLLFLAESLLPSFVGACSALFVGANALGLRETTNKTFIPHWKSLRWRIALNKTNTITAGFVINRTRHNLNRFRLTGLILGSVGFTA